MKTFATPDWEGNKIGDKASEAFANAGKHKKKSPKAKNSKKQKATKISPASKTIKKKSPAKKQKVKITKALKQTPSPKKSPKLNAKQATPKKAVKVAKEKTPNVKSPKVKTKTLKTSPKTAKTLTNVKKPTKVTKAVNKKVKEVGKKLPQTNGTPKANKRKHTEIIATPTKKQKLETPKKGAKSPKTPNKVQTKTSKASPIKQKSPIKKKSPEKKPVKSVKTVATPPKKKNTPLPQKPKSPKLSPTSIVIKKAAKKKVKTKIKIAGLLARKVPAVNGSSAPPKSRADAKKVAKLSKVLLESSPSKKVKKPRHGPATNIPLRVRMMDRLQSARFRYINEELYTKDSAGAVKLFEEEPDAFVAYHEGYRQQVKKWPMNPLSKIIAAIKKMPENVIIADFGCGDAELAKAVKQKVHSFDLVAANETVTACDMAHVPLEKHSVDVAVYCLSLMGTNLQDYLVEANRVLKVGGTLMIAEVESRFDKVDTFITGLSRYGFANVHKDFEHNLFYLMHFRKERDLKNKKNLPTMSLHPCIYKKR